jgi:hypothetical protein
MRRRLRFCRTLSQRSSLVCDSLDSKMARRSFCPPSPETASSWATSLRINAAQITFLGLPARTKGRCVSHMNKLGAVKGATFSHAAICPTIRSTLGAQPRVYCSKFTIHAPTYLTHP